ncbi:phage tail fiber protein [Rhodococcus sp. SJ-2]
MALSVTATKNSLADHWASLGTTYSLHTGNPGVDGLANEVTDASYSRQNTVFGAASGGIVTGTQCTYAVSASTTVTHVCRWGGSTLLDIIDNPDATVTPSGEFKLNPSYTQE